MPSVIESPSDRVPKKAPRWDHMGTEGCGRGKVFFVCLLVYGEYLRIYRYEIRVGGAQGGPQALEARPRVAPPKLVGQLGTTLTLILAP